MDDKSSDTRPSASVRNAVEIGLVFKHLPLGLNPAMCIQVYGHTTTTKFGSFTTRIHPHWTDGVKPLEFHTKPQNGLCSWRNIIFHPPPILAGSRSILRGKVSLPDTWSYLTIEYRKFDANHHCPHTVRLKKGTFLRYTGIPHLETNQKSELDVCI